MVLHQVNLRLEDVERELLKLTKESLTNLIREEADSPLVCPKHCVYLEAEVGKKRVNQKLYVSPQLAGSIRSPTLGRKLSLNLK